MPLDAPGGMKMRDFAQAFVISTDKLSASAPLLLYDHHLVAWLVTLQTEALLGYLDLASCRRGGKESLTDPVPTPILSLE